MLLSRPKATRPIRLSVTKHKRFSAQAYDHPSATTDMKMAVHIMHSGTASIQAYEHLQPGGWMEMQDRECWINSDDGRMDRAPGCSEWIRDVDQASVMFGKRLNIAHQHRQWMNDAGFEDVSEMSREV